ncbi:hypothetical protein CYMTET_27186 [Cymbomonas tetramitiformis]|uniref:tRNA:m(4)X modification enzyme TRM13 n=1 Tax=Cymbomonas tetramitiformis TaxID=36881 RepID=A0AAE0FQA4_9CHLO|nr:hypothetical protein CYMTET_27186 [Cymbomonas tetramitiformis]
MGGNKEARVKGTAKESKAKDGRCGFFMEKKRRYCSFRPRPGSKFCGNHDPDSGERIPCPLDPTHTIFEADLQKHRLICPSRKMQLDLEAQPHWQKGVNCGTDDDREEVEGDLNGKDGTEDTSLVFASSRHILQARRSLFQSMPEEEVRALLEKIHLAVTALCPDEPAVNEILPAECARVIQEGEARAREGKGNSSIPFSMKHSLQQAAIAGQMENVGLLPPNPERWYVEMGAGRGYLSSMLAEAYGACNTALVERRSYRFKAERSIRKTEGAHCERLRIDLADLALDKVACMQGKDLIVTGKHLCGAATDFALRAARTCRCEGAQRSGCDEAEAAVGEAPGPTLEGVAIATCCHHLCNWNAYVNKSFFRDLGFSAVEFRLVAWMTSWANCGDHNQGDAEQDPADPASAADDNPMNQGAGNDEGVAAEEAFGGRILSRKERTTLGHACKRLIDTGRVQWLKQHGLQAELACFIGASTSPENRMLLANLKQMTTSDEQSAYTCHLCDDSSCRIQ